MRLTPEGIQAALARTPGTLRELLSGAADEWVQAHYGAGTFSPQDIVAHLIHAERTNWIPRVEMILQHGDRQAFSEFDRFGGAPDAQGSTMAELLEEFARQRGESLLRLASHRLSEVDYARAGSHPQLGAVTLGQLLHAWVAHDLSHAAQIDRALVWQLRAEVGPWAGFFRPIADIERQHAGLDPFEYSTQVRAPMEPVFNALTTNEGLDGWFTTGAEVDRRQGGTITFRWKDWGPDQASVEDGGPILEWDAPRKVVFQWHPDGTDAPITVSLTLEERADGTVVRVRESGYKERRSARLRQLECAGGWGEALALLKFFVEHGIRARWA